MNSQRFINSYNKIDAQLRNLFDFKSNQSFSDIVRRSADKNLIVRKYENELIDFARLRNAIVHKSIDNKIIAEPNDEVTKKFELIEKLLCTPPTISDIFKDKKILTIEHNLSLKEVVLLIAKTGFSNFPVFDGKRMIGVINNKRIVRAISKVILAGEDVDLFLKQTPCENVLNSQDMIIYYSLMSKKDNIEDVAMKFENNRKLRAVIVTKNGTGFEKVTNLLTPCDLTYINKILEDYE